MEHIAISLKQLYNMCSDKPKEKARKSKILGVRPSRRGEYRFAFIVKSSENYSSETGHIASVAYPDITVENFEEIINAKRSKFTPMNATVLVHCACPAFHWWGSEFLTGVYHYNLNRRVTDIPARVRDPMRKNTLCKHLIKICNYVTHVSFNYLFNRFHYASLNKNRKIADVIAEEMEKDLEMLEPRECLSYFQSAMKERGTLSSESWNDVVTNIESPDLDNILANYGVYVQLNG